MLVHPFFRTAVSQPELLADHASAYAGLAAVEMATVMKQWQLKLTLQALALGLGVIGVGLLGMATMWLGARGAADMPAPWVLAVVPGGFLAAAAGLAVWQSCLRATPDLTALREQWALDQALWHEAAQP